MTISTTASSVVASGNGTTTVFNFSFIAGTASNIVVTYTDASGNETVLSQGSQYTLTLNAAAAGALWGVGGTVTYPLSGSPIAAGTFLTIQRIVPLTQLTSISNQGDFYPQAVEAALDTLCMEIQQVATTAAYSLQFNEADTPPFTTLPPAAERANFLLGFDANGQPACYQEIASGVTVSSAMVPVVEASTTVAALALLGGASLDVSVTTFSTIAALQAYVGNGGGNVALVEGYANGADGGEGLFWYNSSDTTSSDNGGTIIVDSSNRRWYRLTGSQGLYLEWFGGLPTSTDCTSALNKLLAALPSGGGVVKFGPGTFTFASEIIYTFPSGAFSLTFEGQGAQVSTLYWASSNGINLALNNSNHTFHFKDLSFETGAVNTKVGLAATNATILGDFDQSDITRCTFRGNSDTTVWETAIDIAAVSNVNYQGVLVFGIAGDSPVGTGIDVGGSSGALSNIVQNFSQCGFFNLGTGFIYNTELQGVTFDECNFTNCTTGISSPSGALNGAQLAITNSQFAGYGNLISIQAPLNNVQISNSLFFGIPGWSCIDLGAAVAYSTINGNVFTSVGSAGGNAIAIASGADAENGTIAGNVINNFTTGITISSGSNGWNVQGNTVTNCTTPISDGGTNHISGNVGYLDVNSGNATVASTATTSVVAHGLPLAPDIENIFICPQSSLGSAAFWWITNVGTTDFTINLNAEPGSTVTLSWRASLNP